MGGQPPLSGDRLTSKVQLSIRVTPRGGRDAIEGWMDDAAGRRLLKVRVAAAAADGAANAAVVALVAAALKVPRSAVRIVAGGAARVKRLEIEGLDVAALTARLPPP